MNDTRIDAVIVGGGPGGLAVSQQLGARNISNLVLERGDRVGWMWDKAYESLRLHTGKHLSSLPGMSFPLGTSLFPTREQLTAYLHDYADRFRLPVRTGVEATGLEGADGAWTVATSAGLVETKAVVVATGIMSSPVVPAFPGLSLYSRTVIHSAKYKRPGAYLEQSILVVGVGNSGAEIASELAEAGVTVALSVRSGATVIPRSIAGIPSHYLGWPMSLLPERLRRQAVRHTGRLGSLLRSGPASLPRKRDVGGCNYQPVIGRSILEHIRAGRVRVLPGAAEFTRDSVRFTDGSEWRGDTVILATGYRAAMEWMGVYGARDECGFGERQDRVQSAKYPDLYFVGHNYDVPGTLYNIRVDSKRIARRIAASHRQW